jgi:hypothetical protein
MPDQFLVVVQDIPFVALLFTIGWATIVAAAPRRQVALGVLGRLVYLGAAISTGIVGLTTIFLKSSTVGPSWFIGVAVAVYVMAGLRARKSLRQADRSASIRSVMLQCMLCAIIVIAVRTTPV